MHIREIHNNILKIKLGENLIPIFADFHYLMRYLIVAHIMLFWMHTAYAQKYEMGPYLGGSNFIGDVGSTTYINPNSLAVGGIAKWNRGPRHAWRASLIYTDLKANDAKSNQERRIERGYSFSNKLLEFTLGMEYNFWEWDIYSSKTGVTPYLSSGITAMVTHDMYVNAQDEIHAEKRKYGFALPMIVGAKARVSRSFNLGFEVGARMTFYNNLDGSHPTEFSGGEFYPSFGNPNQYDWYMFTGLTLTFAFGQNPCYDVY